MTTQFLFVSSLFVAFHAQQFCDPNPNVTPGCEYPHCQRIFETWGKCYDFKQPTKKKCWNQHVCVPRELELPGLVLPFSKEYWTRGGKQPEPSASYPNLPNPAEQSSIVKKHSNQQSNTAPCNPGMCKCMEIMASKQGDPSCGIIKRFELTSMCSMQSGRRENDFARGTCTQPSDYQSVCCEDIPEFIPKDKMNFGAFKKLRVSQDEDHLVFWKSYAFWCILGSFLLVYFGIYWVRFYLRKKHASSSLSSGLLEEEL